MCCNKTVYLYVGRNMRFLGASYRVIYVGEEHMCVDKKRDDNICLC